MPNAVLKFTNNEPAEIALAFPQGKITQSNFGADQVMYTLEYPPEHITFLDLSVSEKINLLEPARGERIVICKRKGAERNSAVRWDVWLSPEAEAARAARESGVPLKANGRPAWGGNPPPPTYADLARPAAPATLLERQLAESLAAVERLKAAKAEAESLRAETAVTAPGPVAVPTPWAKTLLNYANTLSDVYAAALQHANAYGDAVEPEDVRSFVITAFINLSKGSR